MAILKQWIEEEAKGEPIEGVVIGEMGWGGFGSEKVPMYKECPKNVLLAWEEAVPFISYEFDDGFGAPECQAVTAWTRSKVISVSQYDGSTSVYSLPRHPIDHEPNMVGG